MIYFKRSIFKYFFIIICSIILGYILFYIFYNKKIKNNNKLVEIMISKEDIPVYTLINSNHITYRKIPLKYVQPGALTKKDNIFFKDNIKFYNIINIYRNTQITRLMIKELKNPDMAFYLKNKKRAIFFFINNKDFFSYLSEGDYLDFIISLKNKSYYILQHILIGKVISDENLIILIMKPEEVLKFYLLKYNYEFEIVCRNRYDNKIIKNLIISRDNLFHGKFIRKKYILNYNDFIKIGYKRAIENSFTDDEGLRILKENIEIFKDPSLRRRLRKYRNIR